MCVICFSTNYYGLNLLIYLLTYLHSYIHTPWSRVVLEKLTGSEVVKKFPVFYGTRKFITAFIRALHLSVIISNWQYVIKHCILVHFLVSLH